MKKLLLVIFLLSFHILSFAPNISQKERIQHLLNCNLFSEISYVVSKDVSRNKNINFLPIISPIDTNKLHQINSHYGDRKHPILRLRKHHEGIDIHSSMNTSILATASGYIEKVDHKKGGYGNYIIINHGNGYKTRYAHLNNIIVKENDFIKQGNLIGYSGKSGMAAGPHLHYEIIDDNETIDPTSIISDNKSEYISKIKRIQKYLPLYNAVVQTEI